MKLAGGGLRAISRGWVSDAFRRVERLVAMLRPSSTRGQGEEDSLLAEVSDLDRQDPNWYVPNLLIGAKQMLIAGTDYATVSSVYGEKITSLAMNQLRGHRSDQYMGTSS